MSLIRNLLFLCAFAFGFVSAFAQEARLTGRLERSNANDDLQLYVMGTVGEKRIELANDGSFSVGVDLLERSRAILFWRGRTEEDWTCTFWLQPDSTLHLTLTPRKTRGRFDPKVAFQGSNAALSTYANLYYQTFECENLLDSAYLSTFATFSECQQYIEKTLQPIGEALMNLTDADFGEEAEEIPEDDEDADEAEDVEPEGEDGYSPQDRLEMARVELDYRQAQAEFAYALLRERSGQPMESDAAFRARLDEFDYADPSQADAIAFMTEWRVAAHPEQYAPLTDEAAQLRCLASYVKDEDVRNEVADRIMQHFFLRVQMGEVDPSDPSCRSLYNELRSVCTSADYEEFVSTRLDIMEHPDLYDESPVEEEATEDDETSEDGEEDTDAE